MATADRQPQSALTYQVRAGEDGRVELVGPFHAGERLTVIVIPQTSREFDDKVYTLAQSLAVVRFGAVSESITNRIRAMLADVVRTPNC